MEKIFFDNWESIIRTFIITVLAYISLIAMLRISGKRTLSKMNAFDFIITIALGSAFASVTLNKSITLADGALVFFLLIFMQFLITWLSVRVKGIRDIIASKPTLLLYKGELLHDAMKTERLTVEDLYIAAREKGITELSSIDVAVLETTGTITIISKLDTSTPETLKDVEHFPPK